MGARRMGYRHIISGAQLGASATSPVSDFHVQKWREARAIGFQRCGAASCRSLNALMSNHQGRVNFIDKALYSLGGATGQDMFMLRWGFAARDLSFSMLEA
jgi:hypothetical protein